MIRKAQATHPLLDFRHGDAHRLPFPDSSFDAVTANFAILHLSDPEDATSEFARVLTPGGRVALTVWDQPAHARLFGWILDALDAAGAEAPEKPIECSGDAHGRGTSKSSRCRNHELWSRPVRVTRTAWDETRLELIEGGVGFSGKDRATYEEAAIHAPGEVPEQLTVLIEGVRDLRVLA
jgi:SAM-dependent methyltransferase